MNKENIDLAKKHIQLAEDLVMEESRDATEDSEQKEFKEAEFALEKAEAEIEDLEK